MAAGFEAAGTAKRPSKWGKVAAWIGAAMVFLTVAAAAKPPLDAVPEPDMCDPTTQVSEPGASQCTTGNHLDLLVDGPAYAQRLTQEIDAASQSVWLNVFQIQGDATSGTVIDALIRAKARGVDVRVVVDNRESSGDFKERHPNAQIQRLRDAGIDVAQPDYSGYKVNHRKIVVIDGARAFVTGMNLGGSYLLDRSNGWSYHDAAIFMRGPGVQDLAQVFIYSYVDAGGSARLQLPARSAAQADAMNAETQTVWHKGGSDRYIEREYVQRVDQARERVTIVNGFSMTQEIVDAMIRARDRGVAVTWIWGRASNDTQVMAASSIQQLIDAGVDVRRYDGPLHMKAARFDDHVILGSANLDGFSMWRNDEAVLQIRSAQFAGEVDARIMAPLLASTPSLKTAPTDGITGSGARNFAVQNVLAPFVNR